MFNDTILRNITWSDENISKDKVLYVCELANIKQDILKFPKGLETEVGYRGSNLSGGQRQRVAIARALFKNPEILILDEATSSLDKESEKKINDVLNKLKNKFTIILVTHKIESLKFSDEIIVLKKGRIIEKGSYTHLENNPKSEFSRILKINNQ